MYLDRDVPSNPVILDGEDNDPIDVPNLFRLYVHYALDIAKDVCERLIASNNSKRSEVDFWCDMMDDLKRIERDIELVTERLKDRDAD